MIDNLREDAGAKPFYEEEAQFRPAGTSTSASNNGRFLGMTPGQRFFVAIMLFFAVCSLGAMCLLITQKISLPV
ncbi:MAG TPA: hypothetical protein VGQ19_20040 [Burkholderiales bacterium]|nr:hypothetical protein [Burkholderiales bacterium]